MPRNFTAQANSRKNLELSIATALRIYTPARHQCRRDYDAIHFADYHPVVAAKVIGLAFLSAVAAWEDFIAETFLGYMCGYSAPNGYAPKLRTGTAQNRSHALQLLTSETNSREAERRTRWNNVAWVKSVASIQFRAGDPFTSTTSDVAKHIEWAITIRNRVAHSSEKAKAGFKIVANRLQERDQNTPLDRGFSPGQLLILPCMDSFPSAELEIENMTWGDNFEAYLSLFLQEANRIVPTA